MKEQNSERTSAKRKERPIIFDDKSVRAILKGHKTQTRRVIRFPAHSSRMPTIASVNPDGGGGWIAWGPSPKTDEESLRYYNNGEGFPCPYGKPGDSLWVRETWAAPVEHNRKKPSDLTQNTQISYIANTPWGNVGTWRSARYMPRWASRINLLVTNVRVQQVRGISEKDAAAEGCISADDFADRWDGINARRGYSWDANPWVWVVEFEVQP